MKSKIIYLLACSLLLGSCHDNQDLSGFWMQMDGNNEAELFINNDSLTFKDHYEMYYPGIIDQRKQQFKIELSPNQQEYLDFKLKDSLLVVADTDKFENKNRNYKIAQEKRMDLLGIETTVSFPFNAVDRRKMDRLNLNKYGHRAVNVHFKLRTRAQVNPFQLGQHNFGLYELGEFVQNGACANGAAVHYQYKEVVIFIEKGAEPSDLLALEQFLRLNNRISTFILVTKTIGVGNYKVVVDRRKTFSNDLRIIPKLIEENAKERGEPLPLAETLPPQPPVTPIDHKRGIEHYIATHKGRIITIKNLRHYQSEKDNILNKEQEVILKLSTKMPLEDYLLVLSDIQEARNRGEEVLLHIME